MEKIIIDKLEVIHDICRRHHVARLWVFGSAATGVGLDGNPFGPESDVDLIVRFKKEVYRNDHAGYCDNWDELHKELEIALDHRVDLVPVTSLTRAQFITNVKHQKQDLYVA